MDNNLLEQDPETRLDQARSGAAEPSPLEQAVRLVGDRWTLLVIDALMAGSRKFGELQTAVAGIAPNVLSQRLKHLEREAIVISRPYSDRPLRLRYELTAAGKELADALKLLAHWGARSSADPETLRHQTCGTPLEPRWYCPTCARTVENGERQEEVHFF
jgi:DNA-binding HxlR family transcriptional regulator